MNSFNSIFDRTKSVTEMSDTFERERIHRQMLSVVSHDLKTPLASIIGSLEIYERIKDKLSEEKKKALIDVALSEARRLDAFVTNALDIIRLENDMIEPQPKPVDIRSFLEDYVSSIGSRLRGEDRAEIISLSDVIEITTDPILLNRAIGLIVDNAIKHGGNPLVVHFEFGRNSDGKIFISVRDNGNGIPEAKLRSIVSRQSQLCREDQQPACTGLGLVLCAAIMTLLGGGVDIGNCLEGGAIFTLYFSA